MIVQITVKNKIAFATAVENVVCNNSDYAVKFNFDDEWSAYETKTARFKWGGTFTDVVFTGNECPMPIIYDTNTLEIGVYAGELHTTTAAVLYVKKSILCGNGVEATNSNLLVSNEVIDAMNKANAEQIDAVQKIVNDGYEAVLNAIQNMVGKTETVLCTVSKSDFDDEYDGYSVAEIETEQKIEINADTIIIGRITSGNTVSEVQGYLEWAEYNAYRIGDFWVNIGYSYDSDTETYPAFNGIHIEDNGITFDTLEILKVDYKKLSIEYIRTTDIDNAVNAITTEVESL